MQMETDLALVKKQAKYVGLEVLSENWEVILKEGARKHLSFFSLLSGIIEKEYNNKMEKGRQARIQRARIPEKLVLETFPFSKQPRLDRKTVYQIYDSLGFMKENQDLIFIGPTGCGKTGLATSFLLHAIDYGYRGLFADFSLLLMQLQQARGDSSE
jgi:DNA replication protein DnaC